MSFLSKVFGGKKGDKQPTTGEAIQKLRETEDMLIKKQEFLEKKIEHEIGVARANGTKNKRGLIHFFSQKTISKPKLFQLRYKLSNVKKDTKNNYSKSMAH